MGLLPPLLTTTSKNTIFLIKCPEIEKRNMNNVPPKGPANPRPEGIGYILYRAPYYRALFGCPISFEFFCAFRYYVFSLTRFT